MNIFMLAAGTVLYLFARAIPRVEEDENETRQPGIFERFVLSDIPHRVDTVLNAFLGKLFRRLKIVLMRFDNYLTEQLKKVTNGTNGNGKPKVDYIKEIANGNGASTESRAGEE
jgi:hypothetical protein